MRLLALLPLAALAACTGWHAWQVPPGAGSDTPHVLVMTEHSAIELQESARSDKNIEGTVVNQWKVPSPAGDATLDDLGPEDVATVLGWERVAVSGGRARIARADIVSARAPDDTAFAERGLVITASILFGAAILIGLVTYQPPVTGRPLRVRGKQQLAAVARTRDWLARIEVVAVAEPTRTALAAAWTEAARTEHASIAAFAKLSLELVALGAPPELLARAHAAARQEIEHARQCFGLARAYGAGDVGPGEMPHVLAGDTVDLDRVALESLRDGCIGEGFSAAIARAGAASARDPAVAAILRQQAADEAEHAELAWMIVEWAVAQRESLRPRLVAAIAGARLPACHDLPEHGLISARDARPLFDDVCAGVRARLTRPAAAAA